MEEIVDLNRILEHYENKIGKIQEIVGVWEFYIIDCPVKLKIKVLKLEPQGKFQGIANYGIQNPKQATPYWSLNLFDTVQDALEDALRGFFAFWDPKDADKTKFELFENW